MLRTLVTLATMIAAFVPRAMADGQLRSLDHTGFPEPFALASSWDPALVREAYSRIAATMRANGAHMVLGPSLEIARDPRRGRIEQSFGEDPYLVGEMGLAAIEGLQGTGKPHALAPGKVLAADVTVTFGAVKAGLLRECLPPETLADQARLAAGIDTNSSCTCPPMVSARYRLRSASFAKSISRPSNRSSRARP